MTILLYAQIRGDVLHDPNLGYALALRHDPDHRRVERPLHLAARAQRTVAAMKQSRFGSWLAIVLGTLYFLVPLIATFEFSLRMRRGEYSFDAYRVVLADPRFQATFGYSTADRAARRSSSACCWWCRPPTGSSCACRGCVRWSSSSRSCRWSSRRSSSCSATCASTTARRCLPLTASARATDLLLTFGYVTLALPYMYRAVDTGLRAIDVRTLTEAAESLGAGWPTILLRVILPNIRVAILSGAFLTFAIVIGEFTMASLLNRPAFGPYLQLIGANRAYEPSALAIIAFMITWACMGLINVFGTRRQPAR